MVVVAVGENSEWGRIKKGLDVKLSLRLCRINWRPSQIRSVTWAWLLQVLRLLL